MLNTETKFWPFLYPLAKLGERGLHRETHHAKNNVPQ